MKLLDILKQVGKGVIKSVIPGSGILFAVNDAIKGNGPRLPDDATGDDVSRAISSLSLDDRASLLNHEFDVKLEEHKTLQTMLSADAIMPHTTRPYIAKQAFHVIAFSIVVIVFMWAVGVATSDETMILAVMDGWPFVLAITAPLVVILQAYFGVLKTEEKNRLDASNGVSHAEGLGAFIGNIFKR